MSRFEITEDTILTLQILDSISPKSWSETYTWTKITQLGIVDPVDKTAFLSVFSSATAYRFTDKLIVQKYCLWKHAQKQQVPNYMALDAAASQGKSVFFNDTKKATIASTPPVAVPLSRVPLAEFDLFESSRGPVVRTGSDVLAASIGSMTRWTGSQVVWSMPIDTMAKRQFSFARVDGIKPFLGEIPSGPTETGAKGRMWTYMLMSQFQKMPMDDYAALCTNWVRAMFGFPPPRNDLTLPPWAEHNFSVIKIGQKYHYAIKYGNPGELGRFENAYREEAQYEAMAQQLVEFASERQGDASGVSMLSQSGASWGLVSKTQSELEQTVSLIVGMRAECTLIYGFSRPEVDRIRESVKVCNASIKIYEKVESHLRTDPTRQMVDPSKAGLYLIKMRTAIDTSLVATRMGKIKSYAKTEALTKMWSHVEMACSAPNVVVLTAGLLPESTQINAFPAGSGWNSVFFFSLMKEITKAQMVVSKGLILVPFKPLMWKDCWARIVKGMNNSISYWVVPPINGSSIYTGLLSPVGITKKMTLTYVPDSDEYDVVYGDEPGDAYVDSCGADPEGSGSSYHTDEESGSASHAEDDEGDDVNPDDNTPPNTEEKNDVSKEKEKEKEPTIAQTFSVVSKKAKEKNNSTEQEKRKNIPKKTTKPKGFVAAAEDVTEF